MAPAQPERSVLPSAAPLRRRGDDPTVPIRRAPRLTSRVLQGGALLGGQRIVSLAVAGLGSILLARLLSPEIFGAYAILWFVVASAINTGEMGLTAALIQREEPAFHRGLSPVAVGQCILASLLAAALSLAAPIIAPILGLGSDAVWPLRVLTLLLPLAALRLPLAVLLERRLRYMPLTLADGLDTIVFYGVAVFAAHQEAGLWSFVVGVLAGRCISLYVLWRHEPWRPALPLPWREWRGAIASGWDFQSTALLVQGREAVTPLLVRFLSGVQAVGWLNLASTLALQTVQLTNMAARVLFPAFSQLQHDRTALAKACERALNRVALLVFPATCFLCAAADPVVRLLYGARWLEAIPALQLFCFSALMSGLTMVAIHALNGMGHARAVFRLNVLWTAMLWLLTAPLVLRFGFVGYAMAHALQAFTSVVVFVRLRRLIPLRLWRHLKVPGSAACLAAGLLLVLTPWISDVLRLGAAFGLAAGLYVWLVILLSGADWRTEVSREWRHLRQTRWSHGLR